MAIYLPEIPISHESVLTGNIGWFPNETLGLFSLRLLSFTETPGQFVIFSLRIMRLDVTVIILPKE